MTLGRVGVVGGRRTRQGLGPFLARDLRAAGAEVPCFLVRHRESREEAARQIQSFAGVRPRGYVDLEEMLTTERLDALVIASPHEAHRGHLEAALGAGLHALCEKPLLWGEPDLAADAARLAAAFAGRGLLLRENCQWPHTLPSFERLHRGSLDRPPHRFAMRLQPAARGSGGLADAMPHPLSLLQVLAPGPDPELEDVRFSSTDPAATLLAVEFVYRAGPCRVEARVELRSSDSRPREMWIEVDGRRALRRVTPPDYRLSFESGGRSVPLADPLTRLVADFVRALGSGREAHEDRRCREIVERAALLEQIALAYRRARG